MPTSTPAKGWCNRGGTHACRFCAVRSFDPFLAPLKSQQVLPDKPELGPVLLIELLSWLPPPSGGGGGRLDAVRDAARQRAAARARVFSTSNLRSRLHHIDHLGGQCYNSEVMEVRMGLRVPGTPLPSLTHGSRIYLCSWERKPYTNSPSSRFLFYSLSFYISEQITIPVTRLVLTLPHLRACPPPARSQIVQNACSLSGRS